MKKAFFLITVLLMCCATALQAQTIDHGAPQRMWTVPTVFEVDKPVTFYFDMTDTGFKEGTELYLWCWNPTEPDAGNWGHSSDFAHLTYEGDNIYSITMTPTSYFSGGTTGKTPEDIYAICQSDDWPGFWARLKTRDGSEESDVFQATDSRATWKSIKQSGNGVTFEAAAFQGNTLSLTDKFTLNQPLTIVFNPDVFNIGGTTMTEYAKQAGFNSFNLHSGLNDWTYLQNVAAWDDKCVEKTKLQKQSNGFYTISMKTVYDYYSYNFPKNDGVSAPTGLETDTEIDNLSWLLVGVVNGVWKDSSPDAVQKAGTAEVYPDPQFTIFPTKVCAKDILTLTRKYNGKRDGNITYTLKANEKTIEGIMEGNRDKRQKSVDLSTLTEGSNASSIIITLRNEAGKLLVNTEISLTQPDE